MTGDVQVVVNQEGIDAVVHSTKWRAALLASADRTIVAAARSFAPKRTGAGAASIHGAAKDETDGVRVRVSWDRPHFYMAFQDLGTVRIPAKRFLELAAMQYGATANEVGFGGGTTTFGPRSPRRRQRVPRYGPEGAAARVRKANRAAARQLRAAYRIAPQAGG